MSDIKVEEMTFEAALDELQEIVAALEGGNALLDESLALFERGVALVKRCNSLLDSAEQKVTFLTDGKVNENG